MSNNKIRAGVATYDEVLDSLKDAERLLIDVRDVADVETGQIPTSINIPRKLLWAAAVVFLCNKNSSPRIYSSNYSVILIIYRFMGASISVEKINSELRLSAPAFGAKYERPKPGIYDEIIFYCKIGDKAQIACEYAIGLGFRK